MSDKTKTKKSNQTSEDRFTTMTTILAGEIVTGKIPPVEILTALSNILGDENTLLYIKYKPTQKRLNQLRRALAKAVHAIRKMTPAKNKIEKLRKKKTHFYTPNKKKGKKNVKEA